MKRIISLLVVFSIVLSSLNISFAEDEIIISGLYPIKGDEIRLMSFESNLDFDTFIQDEEYIFKNESDKAQNIEIGLNKDNGIRLPKVKVADQDIQLREEKDKYSFNIDLDKGEYKKIDLSYEVRVNNSDQDNIRYKIESLEKWHKDIIEVKMIFDLRDYIYPEVEISAYPMKNSYDDFNRIIRYDYNVFDNPDLYVYIDNKWKKDNEMQIIRDLGRQGDYISALEKLLEKAKKQEDYGYYDYIEYFAAEYYISDMYDERYPKNQIGEKIEGILAGEEGYFYDVEHNLLDTVNVLTNYQSQKKPLTGKVILLNVEKQPEEAWIEYDDRDKEQQIKAEYKEKLNRLSNEVEELAPNSGIYVSKIEKYDIVSETGEDEYRIWNEYDYSRTLLWDFKYALEDLGATVIEVSYNSENDLLSNKERIDIANKNEVHLVISIGTEVSQEKGNYVVMPSDTYIEDDKLYDMCSRLARYFDESLVKQEYEYFKRGAKHSTDTKTIFNWSEYPIVGLKVNLTEDYYDGKYSFLTNGVEEFFNDKDVQAYYSNHPREVERKELEIVKEKLKIGNKVTESEVMNEVEKENNKKNNSVLIIIGISVAATAVAAILTFIVIKVIKRLRRKKNEQKENNSDSE